MTDWYYADASHARQGPVPMPELLRLRQAGQIGEETLLWREGLAQWQPLRALAHEFVPSPGLPSAGDWALEAIETPPAAAASAPDTGWASSPGTGRVAPADGQWQASPYAPPSAPVGQPDAIVLGHEVVLAGFRKRLAAYVIDGLIVTVAGMIVGGLIGGVIGGVLAVSGNGGPMGFALIQVVANLLSIIITAAYYTWFHASQSMATPGKMAVGIKVVRVDGARISLARSVGRYFATWLSALVLCIGFLMAAFTQRKQALHDMVCDTLVVDKWAFTAHPELQRRELGTVTTVVLVIFGVMAALGTLIFVAAIGMAAFAG